MKTYKLSGKLSFSQATQQIFLREHFTMFPRTDGNSWLYDIPESKDHSSLTGKPLLSEAEIVELGINCALHMHYPMLWYYIVVWLFGLPNQQRFTKATYLQHQVLASSFYWRTIKHMMLN